MHKLVPLRSVPYGEPFMFAHRPAVYESRGNGWCQLCGQTETGGPWHEDGETLVALVGVAVGSDHEMSCC